MNLLSTFWKINEQIQSLKASVEEEQQQRSSNTLESVYEELPNAFTLERGQSKRKSATLSEVRDSWNEFVGEERSATLKPDSSFDERLQSLAPFGRYTGDLGDLGCDPGVDLEEVEEDEDEGEAVVRTMNRVAKNGEVDSDLGKSPVLTYLIFGTQVILVGWRTFILLG